MNQKLNSPRPLCMTVKVKCPFFVQSSVRCECQAAPPCGLYGFFFLLPVAKWADRTTDRELAIGYRLATISTLLYREVINEIVRRRSPRAMLCVCK